MNDLGVCEGKPLPPVDNPSDQATPDNQLSATGVSNYLLILLILCLAFVGTSAVIKKNNFPSANVV
jgi:hypothetical protein